MTVLDTRMGWLATLLFIASISCGDGCEDKTPEDPPGIELLQFGTYHVCTLDEKSQIWCTGKNSEGQLGDGTTSHRSELTQVVDLDAMTGLAVGYFDTTCAWNDDGHVYCWGNNEHRVLGDDDLELSSQPVRIDGLPPVIDVTLGAYHACALTESGHVYCWGNNVRGQLGIGRDAGAVVSTPQRVKHLENIRKIQAGGEYNCAFDANGALSCWGDNSHKQLGLGSVDVTTVDEPALLVLAPAKTYDLEVSFRHSCALFGERRELFCWGNNDYGQFGLDDLEPRNLPTAVPDIAYVDELATATGQVCARIDGEVYCAGEVLRPVEAARDSGEGYFFRPSQALKHTTELWSGVLAICGHSDEHAVACRGVQHTALSGEIFEESSEVSE